MIELELSEDEVLTLRLLCDHTEKTAFGDNYAPAWSTEPGRPRYNEDNREAQRLLPVLEKILKAVEE